MQLATVLGETDLAVEFETVHEPRSEILIQARLMFAKSRLFKFIQELQKIGLSERQIVYQQIKQIDTQIDQYQNEVMKIHDKDIKRPLMDSIVEFKQ